MGGATGRPVGTAVRNAVDRQRREAEAARAHATSRRVPQIAVGTDQAVQGQRVERLAARATRPSPARRRRRRRRRGPAGRRRRRRPGRRRRPSRGARGSVVRRSARRRRAGDGSAPASIASCWSSRRPRSTTNRGRSEACASSSLATISSAQLKSSSSMSEKSSRAVRQSERRERVLDPVADRRAGGPGDEVAVGRRRRLTQQVTDPDRLDHRLSASWAGMVICTWAPGKNGR